MRWAFAQVLYRCGDQALIQYSTAITPTAAVNAIAHAPRMATRGNLAGGLPALGRITILEHSGHFATFFSIRDPCGRFSLIRSALAILSSIAPHHGQLTRMRGLGITVIRWIQGRRPHFGARSTITTLKYTPSGDLNSVGRFFTPASAWHIFSALPSHS